MIGIGQALGAAVKFPGSGGAILGLARPGRGSLEELRQAYEAANFVFVPLDPCGPEEKRPSVPEAVSGAATTRAPAPCAERRRRSAELGEVAWPLQLEQNRGLLDTAQSQFLGTLLTEGQSHLFATWQPQGQDDDEKRSFLQQLGSFDNAYPGGLAKYIRNARELLQASRASKNPLA